MTDERLERVRGRLTPQLTEAIQKAILSNRLPRPLLEALSRPAVEALDGARAPLESMAPVAALEAIVQRTGRPPLLIRNDKVELEPLDDFPVGTDLKIRGAEKWIPSVGRVEFVNHSMRWGGTGWVVERKGAAYIIVTNRHVAKLVAKRMSDGTGAFMRSSAGVRYGANVDFREEADSAANDDDRTVAVTAIDYLADDLAADVALLRVGTSPFSVTPMQLADAEAKKGDLVALIGYPAFDSRNDASDQARYFRDLYDVKRFAPGRVMQGLSANSTLSHDCTTLGGNSGSPVLSLDSGKVVGLHFSGVYGVENSAVGVGTLKKLLKGITTSVAVPAAGAEAKADGHHDAKLFKDRIGFETKFLDAGKVATPWPKLSGPVAAALAVPSDKPTEPKEIRYTHFGVKYSAADRMPVMTAVNIDGAQAVRIKRGDDQWFSDGRIDRKLQPVAANFGDAEIDRGHMVRREDPNWGSEAIARIANDDTFHYVNAAAQHSRLNQGKALWQGLENYILDNARTHGFRACVFTGPILGADDETIDEVRVPMEFWKVVATLDATGKKLHATAYLLSQGQLIRDLMEKRSRQEAMEGVVLGEYRTFQIAVADLAEATGYNFGPYEKADPLAKAARAEAAGTPPFVPLDTLSNIVL